MRQYNICTHRNMRTSVNTTVFLFYASILALCVPIVNSEGQTSPENPAVVENIINNQNVVHPPKIGKFKVLNDIR